MPMCDPGEKSMISQWKVPSAGAKIKNVHIMRGRINMNKKRELR